MAEDKLKALLRSGVDKILLQLNNTANVGFYEIFGATACGVALFPLFIGSFQTAIFRPLCLTCNRHIAPVLGFASVTLSASVTSMAFILYPKLIEKLPNSLTDFLKGRCSRYLPELSGKKAFHFEASDVPLFVGSSLIAFKVFGGRFRSTLPSSLLHPGAFARKSFPAPSQNYASSFKKQKLFQEGRKNGCHSCGRRWNKIFVGDHIPPNKLVKPGQKQRFYPQCRPCSYQQGAAISKSSKKLAVKTHGTSLRLYHLWLPSPLVLVAIKRFTNANSAECSQARDNETDKDLRHLLETESKSAPQSYFNISKTACGGLQFQSANETVLKNYKKN